MECSDWNCQKEGEVRSFRMYIEGCCDVIWSDCSVTFGQYTYAWCWPQNSQNIHKEIAESIYDSLTVLCKWDYIYTTGYGLYPEQQCFEFIHFQCESFQGCLNTPQPCQWEQHAHNKFKVTLLLLGGLIHLFTESAIWMVFLKKFSKSQSKHSHKRRRNRLIMGDRHTVQRPVGSLVKLNDKYIFCICLNEHC